MLVESLMKRRKETLDCADVWAKLLQTFFHVTTGYMNTQQKFWGVEGYRINPKLWDLWDNWKTTQCAGVSASKFGSLVVQAAHSPKAKHWATPFINHPFTELKLIQYLGGLAYDTENDLEEIVAWTISALAAEHDQLLDLMALGSYLDDTLGIRRVSLSPGNTNLETALFVETAEELRVPCTVEREPFDQSAYIFHIVSDRPEIMQELLAFHSMRPDGPKKVSPESNLYIANSENRPTSGIHNLGLTLYRR